MNDDRDRCVGCGEPLDPGAAACGSCGRLVGSGSPPAATRDSRGHIVMATVFGIPAGLLLAVLLLFFTSAAILGDGKSHAELTVVVVAQTVFFAALAGFAIRFCSRGRAGLGAFLIVIGIVAAVPVGACDVVGFDQHYPIQL